MNVDVFVLCAGRGSRLGHLTDSRPKCLTPFLGKPLLEYQLSLYEKLNLENITLVTGYSHESLNSFTVKKIYNPEWQTTNMLQSICLSLEASKNNPRPLLIAYSDIVFSENCLEFLNDAPSEPTIPVNLDWKSLWGSRMDSPEKDAESLIWNENNQLVEIGNSISDIEATPGQFMGLLYLPPESKELWFEEITEYLKPLERKHLSTTEFLQHQIDVGHRIQVFKVNGGWLEVDSVTDLQIYEQLEREQRLKVISGWSNE